MQMEKDTLTDRSKAYKMFLLDKIILKDTHENCSKKPSE